MTKEEISAKQKVYREANKEKKAEYNKAYNKANKDKINANAKKYNEANKDKISAKNKAYNKANKDKRNANAKKYNEANKDKNKVYMKAWRDANKVYMKVYREANKEEIKSRNKVRLKTDPIFKLKKTLRSNVSVSFKRRGFKKNSRTFDVLGCDYNTFIKHIEDKFTDGMTLENQGEWHLDHQIPLALAKTESEVIELCHYTNYQPLWAKDNLEKNAQVRLENISFTNKLRYIKFLNRI
tara:strand:- start:4021 stop:4737 length:717 start_codon:yes stop_codon:yes gene_type:complete